ncbi:MAG: hypothetical protein ACO3O4_12435 [bacterium]|jgi:hypothetical protein
MAAGTRLIFLERVSKKTSLKKPKFSLQPLSASSDQQCSALTSDYEFYLQNLALLSVCPVGFIIYWRIRD